MNILRLPTLSLAVAIAVLALAYANPSFAGKPDKNCDPDKGDIHPSCNDPDKPGNTQTELIFFTGDLEGWAHVEGCCPNAGPNPRYTMVLPGALYDSEGYEMFPPGTYDGYLFMNGYGAGGVSEYIVQFHACCTHEDSVDLCKGVLPEMKFEIIGGRLKSVGHRKAKGLVVTFDEVPWWKDYNRDIDMGPVSFEITRVPSRYCTPEICPPQP